MEYGKNRRTAGAGEPAGGEEAAEGIVYGRNAVTELLKSGAYQIYGEKKANEFLDNLSGGERA